MKRIRLHAYREGRRRYGKIRFKPYKGGIIAFRRVSGVIPGRTYLYWHICGRPKNQNIHRQKGMLDKQKWIYVIPLPSSEERNDIRRQFGKSLHGIFDFMVPD